MIECRRRMTSHFATGVTNYFALGESGVIGMSQIVSIRIGVLLEIFGVCDLLLSAWEFDCGSDM